MISRLPLAIYSCALLCLLAACSNTKHLPAGAPLYVGSKVHIDDHFARKQEKKILPGDLAGLVRPKPNSKVLGIPLKLTLYNLAGTPKRKKGLRAWLRNKVGEAPVLTSSVHINTNAQLMENFLQNRGHFYASATGSPHTNKKRKTTINFEVFTGPQYRIDSTYFIKDTVKGVQASKDIDSDFDNTLLTHDAPYNLELIKAERNRIDATLKEKGYFFFKPDYLIDLVDTNVGDYKCDMYMKLKTKDVPSEAYNVYKLRNIYVYADYILSSQAKDTSKSTALKTDEYYVIDDKHQFKPSIFADVIVFDTGDLYSLHDQNITLSRFVNMGTFKFVKNRFEPVNDSLMDVYYCLTPFAKKSLRFQIGALTQNDNRAGTQGNISWKNRNTFGGAEEFVVKINGGFEAQYTGAAKQPDIYNLGAETDLSFPRFLVPFAHIYTSEQFIPRSVIKLRYNYESESNLLRINSYTASYGYDWKQGAHIEHQLYPINFTYVKTDTLGNADKLSLLYGNLIFDGIILGPTYEFSYNSQVGPPKKNAYFFDGLVDFSGNILGVAENAQYHTHPQTLLGSRYAQYMKFQPDFRYYHRFANGSNTTMFAARVLAGIGIPYGNSEELPNIKQFWAGGNSDLRGFPSRLVGPGTFNEYYEYTTNKYLETLGDMKLELNAEIRQPIYSFINAALFADAGNIWLYNNNPYKDLAVDIGLGLRFDFKIILLRLDLGIPVREPWLPVGDRWVFNQFDFGSSSWRKTNLVYNIAIGYPF
jgi:outer membrane protein insertion porin family